jgi:hypothetical protein
MAYYNTAYALFEITFEDVAAVTSHRLTNQLKKLG